MTTQAKQQTRILVQAAAAAIEDKKGEETRILELDAADAGLSDFFLVTSASNDRQAIAIADEIEDRLKKQFGTRPNAVEGRRQGEWILLDYVDFVVHVFLAERRAFYDIERLRKSARPLTPPEFDAELKSELSAKTRDARSKPAAKKTAAKKAAAKKAPAKKAVAKKAIAKKSATKAAPAKKAAAKPVAAKATKAKPAPAAKSKKSAKLAKKASVAAKAVQAKKPAAKKAVPAKPAAKKSATKKAAKKK